jgi:hypothetical protein
LRKEFIADVAPRYRHGVGKLEREALRFSIEFTAWIVWKRVNLVIGNSELAAHGSIYVLSKLATVEEGDAPVNQGPQTRFY